MSCARGCCTTPAEHYRSLRVANPDRKSMLKRTVDDHGAQGSVEVTQHWHDRQDVLMRPATIRTKWGQSG
jgi:hypothetical protein